MGQGNKQPRHPALVGDSLVARDGEPVVGLGGLVAVGLAGSGGGNAPVTLNLIHPQVKVDGRLAVNVLLLRDQV